MAHVIIQTCSRVMFLAADFVLLSDTLPSSWPWSLTLSLVFFFSPVKLSVKLTSVTFSSIFDNSHHWIKILRGLLHISRHWAAETKLLRNCIMSQIRIRLKMKNTHCSPWLQDKFNQGHKSVSYQIKQTTDLKNHFITPEQKGASHPPVNGHILQYKMFGEYCRSTLCTVFKDKFIFILDMIHSLLLLFLEQCLSDKIGCTFSILILFW